MAPVWEGKALNTHYQVIIVGAGPAGLATAMQLRARGITNVLVIEHKRFPRYKCCAGYITGKTRQAYSALGLDPDACHYSLIRDFNIFYRMARRQTIVNRFLYTNDKIDRVELDDAFFRLARDKGVEVREDTRISSHDMDANTVVLNDGTALSYDTLVFADGTTGFGSRYQHRTKKNIAMQRVFPDTRPDAIEIHFGVSKHGYAWVSSYQGITNVGLTDVFDPQTDYRALFADFLSRLGIEPDLTGLRAAFTPIGTGVPVLHGNVYFVGDAVGACDPLTLSGLRYGLKTGERCAEAIRAGNSAVYTRFIRGLGLRFRAMAALQKLFYRKWALGLVFNVGCRYFSPVIAFFFNHFFVNKK